MKLYFSGLGGKALAPLANLALDAGHQVFGSDSHPDPAVDELIKRGVEFSEDQSGEFLDKIHQAYGIDWIIYTSALPADHAELSYAKKHDIKCTKRDQFLPQFLSEHKQKLIAVAGTHGKTTTTTMLVWLFRELGLPLSYLVGSDLPFAHAGKLDKQAEYFVYECDEFDHNFLHYYPDFSLIPAITYDHKEYFPSVADYRQAFAKFIAQSKQTWLWERDFYDEFKDLPNISVLKETDPRFKSFGDRNRENQTLILELIRQILPEYDEEQVIKILDKTPRPGRRFEELLPGLFTDYGHLPDEIRALLSIAREYAPAHNYDDITVIYQPYQNLRQYQIRHEYPDVFGKVEKLYWLPTSLVRESASDREVLSSEVLTEGLPQAIFLDFDNKLIVTINQALEANNLVLFISGGKGDEWLRKHLGEIKSAQK